MPCGGIYPITPSTDDGGRCYVCNQPGSELFCEEWDTGLHRSCLGAFLNSDDGRVVLQHGHEIYVPEVAVVTREPDPAARVEFLQNDIAECKMLGASLAPTRVIERQGLEARIAKAEAELARIAPDRARVEFLRADRAACQELFDETPDTHVVERAGLEERIGDIDAERGELGAPPKIVLPASGTVMKLALAHGARLNKLPGD